MFLYYVFLLYLTDTNNRIYNNDFKIIYIYLSNIRKSQII